MSTPMLSASHHIVIINHRRMFALADGDVASESSSVRVANTANVGVA